MAFTTKYKDNTMYDDDIYDMEEVAMKSRRPKPTLADKRRKMLDHMEDLERLASRLEKCNTPTTAQKKSVKGSLNNIRKVFTAVYSKL